MNANRAPRRVAPWISVGAVILAAVLFGIALIVGNWVLIIIAIAILVATGLEAAVVPRRLGTPITFSEEFPGNTVGPRATSGGDSSPPIDTQRHPDQPAPGAILDEVAMEDYSTLPDKERVFPQYVNLPPEDRLRSSHGHEYIEKGRDLEAEPEEGREAS